MKDFFIILTSNPTFVLIADFNETWHTCRAVENNRYVFFYICNGASLWVTTTLCIYKYEY